MAEPDGNEPVPFDDATADALTEAFDAAAADLDAQTTSRASLVTTASTDFRGLFSELFASNADTARQGASNLAECLRTVAVIEPSMVCREPPRSSPLSSLTRFSPRAGGTSSAGPTAIRTGTCLLTE